jgi:hypothetical protein
MTISLDDHEDYVDITPDGSVTRIFKNVNPVEDDVRSKEAADFLAYEDFILRKPKLMDSGIEKLIKLGLTKDEVMALLGTYSA